MTVQNNDSKTKGRFDYSDYIAVCLNGTIKTGDEVMTTPAGDYPCMRGRVLCIYPEGSPKQMQETENEGCDDVHVEFITDGLSPERIAEIEAQFTDLYGSHKTIDDIALDDDIEGSDVLININGISKELLERIDQSENSAREVAFSILADYFLVEEGKGNVQNGICTRVCKEFDAGLLKNWIEGILKSGKCNEENRIRDIYFLAESNNTSLWPVQDIPDAVLRIAYGITEPISREVLADMSAHGKAMHWLESLGICHYKCSRGECDGIMPTKTNPQNRPCTICAKQRAVILGLLPVKEESGAV